MSQGRRRHRAPPASGLFYGALAGLLLGVVPSPVGAQAADAAAAGEAATQLAGVDDPLLEGSRLLAEGMPLAAARLLSLALSEGRLSGPAAVLLTARAHAGYGDWEGVHRLLGWQPWLQEASAPEAVDGHRLLARSLLALDSVSRALEVYERLRELEVAGPRGGPRAEAPAAARPRAAAAQPRGDADARGGGPPGTAEGAPGADEPLEAPIDTPLSEPGTFAVDTLPEAMAAVIGHAAALERAGRHLEAAELRLAAAAAAPSGPAARWLRLDALRSLAAGPDTARANRLAAELLRDRVLPADSIRAQPALAAFRAGDARRGVELARGVTGAPGTELDGTWVGPALLAAGDSAGALGAFRRALSARGAPEAVGTAVLALEEGWRARADVGSSDLREGRARRARTLFEEALRTAPDAERPALAERLASAHAALGDHAGTLAALSAWLERDGLEAERRASLWMAAYGALNRLGREAEAMSALERAAEAGAGQAAFASFLLADRHHDRGDLDRARAGYRATAERFPRTRFAELARARLGIEALVGGRALEAAGHFEDYRRRYPRGEWAQGAVYWSARAREAAGQTGAARSLYLEALGQAPQSYYGVLAADRLGRDFLAEMRLRPAPDPRPAPETPALLERLGALRELGWSDRARAELRAAPEPRSDGARLALSLALGEAGWTSEGVRRAWALQARSTAWTEPLLRAVYPLPYAEALRTAAEERGLDPGFVAAVTRRESMFDREAVSPAGAVGLMQLMPATARAVAGPAGLADLRLEQLTVPEVSFRLGTWYLAEMLDRFGGSRVAALVAYNAGPHRWLAWRDFPEAAADEELFTERIPFRETREYVRAVTSLARIYERLYPDALRVDPPSLPPAETRSPRSRRSVAEIDVGEM